METSMSLQKNQHSALVASLKACADQKDLHKGSRLHADILRRGLLKSNVFIGNALVNMYAKCGALAKAQHVFEDLPCQNVVSWNALIAGYSQHGHGVEALECFEQMQCKGLSPNAVTFTSTLKACASIGAVEKGEKIHAQIIKEGLLEKDYVLGNALIDMYAKCGALAKAQLVFNKLPLRNVVTWNALIAGYSQHGHSKKVLNCFERLECEGISANVVTLTCILKACGSIGAANEGKEVHSKIVKEGLMGKDSVLDSAVVDMYAKCGALAKAQEVFDDLPFRDLVSWTALIAGYAQHGLGEQALSCFKQMQCEGLIPDIVTFICILKACGSIAAVEKGEEIHFEIARVGLLGKDGVLGSGLVDMYSKCGAFAKARQVFDELPIRNAVSWNALISGYIQHNYDDEALNCFEQMQLEGVSPSAVTFVCILKACGSVGAVEKGVKVHTEIVRRGLLGNNSVLGNALVDMYFKCGVFVKAQQIFDELAARNVVSWNVLIAGYSNCACGEQALKCFELMHHEGLAPDVVTFACILKACGSIGAAEKGKELHAKMVGEGLLGKGSVLASALVDMYCKSGVLAKAQEVFDELPERNVLSWNALIAGYSQHGCGEEALNCFEWMQCEGLSPDAVTFACILKAYGSLGAAERGKALYAETVRMELLKKDRVLGNAVVDMFVNCGAFAKAQQVFDELPIRNVVSWNVLIAGYSRHGHGEEALNCYDRMQREAFAPNAMTFACILKACGSIGAIEKGKDIHVKIIQEGFLREDIVLGNALVDMYGKCGALSRAQQVFYDIPVRNIVSWNSLIAGYSQHGHGEEALNCYKQMQHEGLFPDAVSFLCILNACSCLGLVDEGHFYFNAMITSHDIIPTLEHHTCMVDLYGRGGHFDKAIAMIKKMPSTECFPLWLALLGKCQKSVNVEYGRLAFEHAIQLDELSAVPYVYMSEIYAAAGMQEDADKIEALRMENEARKLPGCCWWIDISGNVRSFCVGDKGHSQAKKVYSKLEAIAHSIAREGYCPALHLVSQDMLNDAM